MGGLSEKKSVISTCEQRGKSLQNVIHFVKGLLNDR